MASNRTDAVVARTAQADWPANLQFRTTTGLPVSAQPTAADNARKLTVTGTSHETTDELTAFISETDSAGNEQQTVVGQLNLISYDELRQKVIIVPVADEAGNQALAPNAALLERTLNDIYGQAVAHWEVVVDQPLTVAADRLNGLDEGQSGLLASFPQKMRQFNRAFKRSRDIDNDAYYLFLIPPASDGSSEASKAGPSRLGFMPFKKQFGYIFTEQANDLSHTIAHELGHGAFRLRHPFDERGLAQGSTDNLMDYSQGTQLYKYQWDNVHNPEAMVSWLQDDDESAYSVPCYGIFDDCDDVLRMLAQVRDSRINKRNILVKSSYKEDTTYEANNVTIDETDYEQIRIIIYKNPERENTVEVTDCIAYDKRLLMADGSTDHQTGFALMKEGVILAKILVIDHYSEITEKLQILRKYLFGEEEDILLTAIEKAFAADRLEPEEIKLVRGKISKLEDKAQRAEQYKELQKK